MKKAGLMVIALALCCGIALAGMDAVSFGTGQTIAASTNAVTLVLRGELYGVYVDVGTATTRTQTVTVASAQQTLFTKAVTADGWYPLMYRQYGSTGAALGNTTNDLIMGRAPVAGDVTVTVVGGNGANKTNTTAVTVVLDK